MAQPTANIPRNYRGTLHLENVASVPVAASTALYAGAALGEVSSDGTCRLLNDGDTFVGFSARGVDNSAGAANAEQAQVYTKGFIELTVTGVDNINDLGATVYVTEGNTFSLTDSGSDTSVGKVHEVTSTSNNTAIVYFEAAAVRSL